jgi:hypothetical protein
MEDVRFSNLKEEREREKRKEREDSSASHGF